MASRPTGDEPRQGASPSDGAVGAQPNAAEAPESRHVPAPEDDQNLLQLLRHYGPGAFRVARKHYQGAIPEELLSVLAGSGEIDESTKDQIRPLIEDHLNTLVSQLATRHSLFLVYVSLLRDAPTLMGHLLWIVWLVVLIPSLLFTPTLQRLGALLVSVFSVIALLLEMFIALGSVTFFGWLFGHLGIRVGSRLPAFLVTTLMFVVLAKYATVIGGPDWVVLSIRSASWAVAAFIGCFILIAQGLLAAVMLLSSTLSI
jgi:hypothetical protein